MKENKSKFDHVKIVCDLFGILKDQKDMKVLTSTCEDGFTIEFRDSKMSTICDLYYIPDCKDLHINEDADLDTKTIYALNHVANEYGLEFVELCYDEAEKPNQNWAFQ